jgi:hypothetical protein
MVLIFRLYCKVIVKPVSWIDNYFALQILTQILSLQDDDIRLLSSYRQWGK